MYFIANWKMHHQPLPAWVQHMAMVHVHEDDHIVLCPPFTQLAAAQMVLTNTTLDLGAQDCHAEEKGAFTGDISAEMLKRSGCSYAIVGHSERRHYHGENNTQVMAKAAAVLRQGLCPIVCIGEQLAERKAGNTLRVLDAQLDGLPEGELIVAYEPVWAIGSGLTPTTEQIAEVHTHIKKRLHKGGVVVYGGSVKPENAAEILATQGVDGVLVGGASLDAGMFGKIVNSR